MVKEWIAWKTNKQTKESSFHKTQLENSHLLLSLFSRNAENSHRHVKLFYAMMASDSNIMHHINIWKEARTWKEAIFVKSKNEHIVIIPRHGLKFSTAFVKDIVSGNSGMLLMEEGESLEWNIDINVDRVGRRNSVDYFLYKSRTDNKIRIVDYQGTKKIIATL